MLESLLRLGQTPLPELAFAHLIGWTLCLALSISKCPLGQATRGLATLFLAGLAVLGCVLLKAAFRSEGGLVQQTWTLLAMLAGTLAIESFRQRRQVSIAGLLWLAGVVAVLLAITKQSCLRDQSFLFWVGLGFLVSTASLLGWCANRVSRWSVGQIVLPTLLFIAIAFTLAWLDATYMQPRRLVFHEAVIRYAMGLFAMISPPLICVLYKRVITYSRNGCGFRQGMRFATELEDKSTNDELERSTIVATNASSIDASRDSRSSASATQHAFDRFA